MISQTVNTWQNALKEAIRTPEELIHLLDLNPALLHPMQTANQLFPLLVPKGFLARIKKGDPNDPLLKQILPLGEETKPKAKFTRDPLQEKQANPLPGLLHKYHGRVLIIPATACAIHCRYCFRREFPYTQNLLGKTGFENILTYLKTHVDITEVILSGGDPLLVNDRHLEKMIASLETIPHLKILRIHSRIPIVLPERITVKFVDLLKQSRLKTILVIHANHPNEIDQSVKEAIHIVTEKNILVLNQSVLLKSINDDPCVLETLSYRLFENNILPYYLHQLDPVQGISHFEVPLPHAKKIVQTLKNKLPGYLVPKFVQEQPGAKSKITIL